MPIEFWSTKDVWEYLFKQSNDLMDIDFLWKIYSDASGKDTKECTFVGAGGKHIEEGKIGCGVSRFGCWQCYMVRDHFFIVFYSFFIIFILKFIICKSSNN